MKYMQIMVSAVSLASTTLACAEIQTIFGYAHERSELSSAEQLNCALFKSINVGNVCAVGVALSLGADCQARDKAGNSAHYHVQILSQEHPKQAQAIMRLLDEQAS